MLPVLAGVVVPVFAVALAGAWLKKTLVLDPGPVSRLALYLLIPCLIFSNVSRTRVPVPELARVALGVALVMAVLYLLGLIVARITGASPQARAGYLLSTVFINSGNYGLPLLLFAFGEEGFAIGVLYFVTQSFLTNTAGAYVASRGKASAREALGKALRVPALYAALLALPFPLLGIQPPSVVLRPVELVGRAAIPMMLLLLGAQLRFRVHPSHLSLLAAAIITRLVISPLIAVAIALMLGFSELTRAVFIIESAMPTAVLTVVLSMEFDAETEFLAGVVAYSTLLSLVSLSLLIPLLR